LGIFEGETMSRNKLLFFVALTVFCAPALAYDWSVNPGDGSSENPYQISTAEQLMSIGADPVLLTKHYRLMNDIVFEPETNPQHVFTKAVIAAYTDSSSPAFTGLFDGRNHSISNLKVVGTNVNVGLFGILLGADPNQTLVRDLTLINAEIAGSMRCGALVGSAESCKIERCHAIGGRSSQTEGGIIGGLAGAGFYTILSGCTSSAAISGKFSAGGLIGSINSCALLDCSASGPVSGTISTGGLVGNVQAWTQPALMERHEIVRCYATGTVHAATGKGGGLIGTVCIGLVQDCYATGHVTGGSTLGGLIGNIEGERINHTPSFSGPTEVIGCFAAGHVEGAGDLGGLVGYSAAVGIRDCYALGNVRGAGGACAGGLIGLSSGPVARCFSKGTLAGTGNAGGLIGLNYSSVFQSFWDTQTSLMDTSEGGVGKDTALMQSRATYRCWGNTVWTLNDGTDYPRLAWEKASGTPIFDVRTYDGDGSAENPFRIRTAEDLLSAGTCAADWDKHFELADDIVLDPANLSDPDVVQVNANFNTIGVHGLPFSGSFNGNFHYICNLRGQNNTAFNGLFSYVKGSVAAKAVLRNVTLVSPAISGDACVGSLAGWLEHAEVLNCGAADVSIGTSGTSFATVRLGGLVGFGRNSLISRSYAKGTVNRAVLSSVQTSMQGGLVGSLSNSAARNSYAICAFPVSDGNYDGGFVGDALSSHFQNCYAVPSPTGWYTIAGFAATTYEIQGGGCYYRAGNNILNRGGWGLWADAMKQRASFSGWDFLGESSNGLNEIWRMCADGLDYPQLSWESAQYGDFVCPNGVYFDDLLALAAAWLGSETENAATFNYACDSDGNGRIDLADFQRLAGNLNRLVTIVSGETTPMVQRSDGSFSEGDNLAEEEPL
jgi:hypothetical protein